MLGPRFLLVRCWFETKDEALSTFEQGWIVVRKITRTTLLPFFLLLLLGDSVILVSSWSEAKVRVTLKSSDMRSALTRSQRSLICTSCR